jgi:hypothetical protein
MKRFIMLGRALLPCLLVIPLMGALAAQAEVRLRLEGSVANGEFGKGLAGAAL